MHTLYCCLQCWYEGERLKQVTLLPQSMPCAIIKQVKFTAQIYFMQEFYQITRNKSCLQQQMGGQGDLGKFLLENSMLQQYQ